LFNLRITQIMLITFLAAAGLRANGPRFWSVESEKEFQEGKFEQVSLTEDEILTLAPRIKKIIDTGQPFVWCLALDPGGNIYAATGHEGRVLRIGPAGDTTTVFDADKPEVMSMAVNSAGDLYAATSPDGAVYRIPGGNGKAQLYFDPEEKYIWSLAFSPDGELYAAVGSKGRVYRVGKDQKAKLILDSNEDHIISLAVDRQGNILAGSSGDALVYQIDPRGQVSILYDSPLKDVRSIVVDKNNNVFVAAFNLESAEPPPMMPKIQPGIKPQGTNDENAKVQQTPGGYVIKMPQTPRRSGANSEIYYFDKDRYIWRLWHGEGEAVMALGLTGDGRAVFLTGDKQMKLFTVDRLGDLSLLSSFEEKQVTGYLRDQKQGRLLICTSNLGKIFEVRDDFSSSGKYTSKVNNAGLPSQWGRINPEAETPSGTDLYFRTRSGNTSRPDTTWSRWSAPYRGKAGEVITSPPRQYFQWQAELSTSNPRVTPRLENVTISYLRRNQEPRISRIRILPPGLYIKSLPAPPDISDEMKDIPEDLENLIKRNNKSKPGNPFQGKKEYGSGYRMAGWNANDANEDELLFNVEFRGVDETVWRPLEKDSRENSITWDTRSMADGRYLLRVTAHDSLSNSMDRALITMRVSPPFVIDNTTPVVENFRLNLPAGNMLLEAVFEARDATNIIKSAEVSIDAGDWRNVLPVDSIADHRNESYRISFPGIAAGEHTVSVRVYDEFHNMVTASRTVVVR
jgi:WD40 repeat protein